STVVVVPDYQLSLAIGKRGQNARLAAKLTGWKIDIKSETDAREAGVYPTDVEGTEDQLNDVVDEENVDLEDTVNEDSETVTEEEDAEK
ncbi:MAG: transcription termination factor NusA, partial [Staphylococcus equorum]